MSDAELPTIRGPGIDGPEAFRYAAFISYRHVEPDRRWAKWLHTALETYRVPKRLTLKRHIPTQGRRVFRDEDELSASADLNAEIEQALHESRYLIVVCSPRTPHSQWVNKEVERFREIGRSDKILALLIEGEPHESFPLALREIRKSVIDAQGLTRDQVERIEPLAADVRIGGDPASGHGRRQAKLRILANILGVRYDDLRQRERVRRRRKQMIGSAAAVAAMAVLAVAIVMGVRARTMRKANDFARRFDAALETTNWSTQAVKATDSLLEGWSRISADDAAQARLRLNRALAADAEDRMTLPHLSSPQITQIQNELLLLQQRDLALAAQSEAAFQSRLRVWEPVLQIAPPFTGLPGGSWSKLFKKMAGNSAVLVYDDSQRDSKTRLDTPISTATSVRVTITLDPSWEDIAGQIGLLLLSEVPSVSSDSSMVAPVRQGYRFVVNAEPASTVHEYDSVAMHDARSRGGVVDTTIIRGADRLRSRLLSAAEIAPGPLRLTITREQDRISFQVNDLRPLELLEAFPLTTGSVGFILRRGDRVEQITLFQQPLPRQPNPLEAADGQFARGQYTDALAAYQSVALVEKRAPVRQEAQYKQAVCLLKSRRSTEAIGLLERLTAEPGERWPPAAGCLLWLNYRELDRLDDAAATLDVLHTRFTAPQLAAVASQEARSALAQLYRGTGSGLGLLRRSKPEQIARLADLMREEEVLDVPMADQIRTRLAISRAESSNEQFDQSRRILDQSLEHEGYFSCREIMALVTDYACLMRMNHEPQQALQRIDKISAQHSDASWALHFDVERARLLHNMNRAADAERELTAAVAEPAAHGSARIEAWLMLGFLREAQNDTEKAREAWRAGLHNGLKDMEADGRGDTSWGNASEATLALLAIGCLSDISNDDLQKGVDSLGARLGANAEGAVLERGAFHLPAAAMRNMLQDSRGHEWARRFAFRQQPMPQLIVQFSNLYSEHVLRNGSLSESISTDQQAIYARVAEGIVGEFREGRIGSPQLLQLTLTWKGALGLFGWRAVAPSIDPSVRPSLAYVAAMRYLRIGKNATAIALFKEAQTDARGDPVLARVVAVALQRASASSHPTSQSASGNESNPH